MLKSLRVIVILAVGNDDFKYNCCTVSASLFFHRHFERLVAAFGEAADVIRP
jgi:hypothetical protein